MSSRWTFLRKKRTLRHAFELFGAQILGAVLLIALVKIAVVNALHIHLTVGNSVGERGFQQLLYLCVVHGAALHGGEVIGLVDKAPINDEFQLGFEDMVEPDSPAAPVSLAEWVGNIHLNIFLYNLVKGGLRHFVNAVKSGFQILRRGKSKVALRDIFCADSPAKS